MAAQVRGLDEVIGKLRIDKGALKRPMTRAAAHLLDTIAKYPPATSANSPPGNNGYSWYERGFGTRTITGLAFPTSETLGRRWTMEVSEGGQRAVVGNNASYAPEVQGADQQKAVHARNGWETDAQVAEKERDKVVGFFDDEIKDLTK